MHEQAEMQQIPVKMYRSEDRLVVAAPMPGLESGDISVEITADGYLVLHGALRGALKGLKDLLLDEWSVGDYHRVLQLPDRVNGDLANVTYGNGVLVVALPIQAQTRPATLRLDEITPTRGSRVGGAGHPAGAPVLESMGGDRVE
ncbi:MAG TPA: Hsp20/alpha crystallin family protein [Ktedonobacterales bacterium]|nr:Hsp20/alpha crystallin family protein [Ktedonobacterales bacterium]